ncbi:MAG: flagellin [Myxococcales bacterium]|nr:flagellin [Myxococcales bacterium]MDD9970232.1 flagellin [Myxococcales bacterium]
MPLMSIVSNVSSINAQRNLGRTQQRLTQNMGRLSSGLRINRSGDDAAGLAISEKLRSQTRSLAQAERNGMDGVSMLQTAEGAMNEINGILTRMRELAIQSSTDTNSDTERGFLDLEFQDLISEIDRIANVTEFNGTQLLNQTGGASLDFQIGIENTSNDRVTVTIDQVTTDQIGTAGTPASLRATSVDSKSDAQLALDSIDDAIEDVVTARADIGTAQNRLSTSMANLGSMRENLTAADSRIRDVDVAEETAEMTRNSILMQAGVAVLAQANQSPSMALSLIG